MLKKIFIYFIIVAAAAIAFLSIRPRLIIISGQSDAENEASALKKAELISETLPPTAAQTTAAPEIKQVAEPEAAEIIPTNSNTASSVVAATPAAYPPKTKGQEAVLLNPPFTSQAPYGGWKDQKQQDGCEEAAALMAYYWASGKSLSRDGALIEITAISDYEQKEYGNYHDTAVADTIERIFKGYFHYPKVQAKYGIGRKDIADELAAGNLIIVPTDGRLLGNPYYTPPGPDRHNLLIKGYDPAKDEFITNDPGTKRGEGYRYKTGTVIDAIVDYPTGNHLPIAAERKAMIIVSK